jgi:hypothetical protein
VCGELFVFSKLAVKNNVVPADGWCWNEFLAKAVELVKYAFEKSDVREMYGGETINVMTTLRFIGEMIYQSTVVGFNEFSPDEGAVNEALFRCALFDEDEDGGDDDDDEDGDDDEDDAWMTPLDDPRMTPLDRAELRKNKREALCRDVGGLRAWLDLQDELRRNPGPIIGD